MELLKTAALASALLGGTACYSPRLDDCVVACGADSDCAPSQTCGVDRMCAWPELSGACASLGAPDAALLDDAGVDGPRPVDARPDAASPVDAPGIVVQLRIKIDGSGSVAVQGHGSCDDDCTYLVAQGVPLTLHATPSNGGGDWKFDKWQGGICSGPNPTCLGVPAMNSTTTAKFREDD